MTPSIHYILTRLDSPLHSRELKAIYMLSATLQPKEAVALHALLTAPTSSVYYETVRASLLEILREKYLHAIYYPRYRPIEQVIELARTAPDNESLYEELQERFDKQSYEVQCALLHLFLSRPQPEDRFRDFAYEHLRRCWDERFAPQVEHCWLRYRDCAALVIAHLSEAFVLQHAEELKAICGYKTLCLRLCNNPAFHIEPSLLPYGWDYLEVMQRMGYEVNGADLLKTLLLTLEEELTDTEKCVQSMQRTADNIPGESRPYASLKLLPLVEEFIYGMSRLGLQEPLLALLKWDELLRDEHLACLDAYYCETSEVVPTHRFYRLFCDIAARHLRQLHPHYRIEEDKRRTHTLF